MAGSGTDATSSRKQPVHRPSSQRLAQLVRQSRGNFARQRNPRKVNQLRLALPVASFGLK